MPQAVAHAIRTRQCVLWRQLWANHGALGAALSPSASPPVVQSAWPVVAEEYLEYADLLAAVDEYASHAVAPTRHHRPFTLVELGCGYAHWALAASAALRQRLAGRAPPRERYILVDLVPSLNGTVAALASANGIDASDIRFHAGVVVGSAVQAAPAVQAAVLERESATWESNWQGVGSQWRAQRVTPSRPGHATSPRVSSHLAPSQPSPSREVLSLEDLLSPARGTPECIDLVDIDVQGGEYADAQFGLPGLFHSPHTAATLTRRVRRLHIGLHGTQVQDARLLSTLRSHGWELQWYYPQALFRDDRQLERHPQPASTPWGPVRFSDGVLSMINPTWPARCRGDKKRENDDGAG